MYYFAYGSNMDMVQMIHRCPGAVLVSAATLQGYRFLVNSRGVATVVAEPGAVVHGVLWTISKADDRALDRYEGVGRGFYVKAMVEVHACGTGMRDVLVYVSPNVAPGRPRSGYIEKIVTSAESHSFPSSYTKELRRWLGTGE